MVTLGVSLMLGEVANRYSDLTGGADGLQGVTVAPILGLFRFDLYGHNGYVYCLIVLFVCFVIVRRIVDFAVRPVAARGQRQPVARGGGRHSGELAAGRDLYDRGLCLSIAGALLTQTTAFCSLDVFSLDRSADLLLALINIHGTGYLYGGLIGAVIYRFLQDWISTLTPQYWQFCIGRSRSDRAGWPRPHWRRQRSGTGAPNRWAPACGSSCAASKRCPDGH